MTTATRPELPADVLALIAPAVDAITTEVQEAVRVAEGRRLYRKGVAAYRTFGGSYGAGINAILADAVPGVPLKRVGTGAAEGLELRGDRRPDAGPATPEDEDETPECLCTGDCRRDGGGHCGSCGCPLAG